MFSVAPIQNESRTRPKSEVMTVVGPVGDCEVKIHGFHFHGQCVLVRSEEVMLQGLELVESHERNDARESSPRIRSLEKGYVAF